MKLVKKMNKNKKKQTKYRTEEQQEIIRFAIVLLVVIVFVGIVYLFTKTFVTKENKVSTNAEYQTGEVSYDTLTVGTLLNRPYEEYFVAVYDKTLPDASYYSSIMAKYEYTKKIYFLDLSDFMNENYIAKEGETSNPKAKKIEDLKFGTFSFLQIKDGKIVKYLEDEKKAEEVLK